MWELFKDVREGVKLDDAAASRAEVMYTARKCPMMPDVM